LANISDNLVACRPALLDGSRIELGTIRLTLWKMARIGERLSPVVSVGCLAMAYHKIFLA
jgi:hypothetical protein